jgi:hypothetical protein
MRRAETVDEATAADPADLVTLAELAAEGFGWTGSPYVVTPKDAIDVLAGRFAEQVSTDDLGRRVVPRQVARDLFAERDAQERSRREAQARNDEAWADLAARSQPWAGVSATSIPDGVSAATVMLQAAKDALPRRQSVLEHALANEGEIEYVPVEQEPG